MRQGKREKNCAGVSRGCLCRAVGNVGFVCAACGREGLMQRSFMAIGVVDVAVSGLVESVRVRKGLAECWLESRRF